MSDALRADEFDLMLSTLRYVLGAGQAKNGEKARDHYNAIICSIANRAERTESADVRFACEAVKRAALSAPPPVVPAGWQLVPVEPTQEIAWAGVVGLEAASQSDLDATLPEMMAAYRAMIAAAAPQAPTQREGD